MGGQFDINEQVVLATDKNIEMLKLNLADELCGLILDSDILRSEFGFQKKEILQLREYYASLDYDVLVVILLSIKNLVYQLTARSTEGQKHHTDGVTVCDKKSFEKATNPDNPLDAVSPYEVDLSGLEVYCDLPLNLDCNVRTGDEFIKWIVDSLISDLGVYNLVQIIKDLDRSHNRSHNLDSSDIHFLSKRFKEHNIDQIVQEVKKELSKLSAKSLIYLYISLAEKVSPFLDRNDMGKHINTRLEQLKHILGLKNNSDGNYKENHSISELVM